VVSTRAIAAAEAPGPSGPYSQAVIAGQFMFLAGQRPVEPHPGAIPSGFTAQAEQALSNVRAVLRSAGADLSNVVKVTAYLDDLADFERLNEIFRSWFTEPYPARTTVGARLRGVLVELDVTAVLPGDASTPGHA
jgi:2-iminobutanoate/2-iminopropanoate deaminase